MSAGVSVHAGTRHYIKKALQRGETKALYAKITLACAGHENSEVVVACMAKLLRLSGRLSSKNVADAQIMVWAEGMFWFQDETFGIELETDVIPAMERIADGWE